MVNNGETATVKVGNDDAYTLNTVENPVPEVPQKRETAPYVGVGVLGAVKVGDDITYEISYKNYKAQAADIVINDKLDGNVAFVSASDGVANNGGTVNWTIKAVPAGKAGVVTLTVKVLEGALESNGGPAKVVNGGDTATVQVGNDHAYTLNTVENPVPEAPQKRETAPYVGNGVLGGVQVGDNVTYEISYKNYKAEAADIVITDRLDRNEQFVAASDGGVHSKGVVTWTLSNVPAGAEGVVTLKVRVLEGALKSKNGPAKVVNGGETATVQVGNDKAFTLNTVENPVPEGDGGDNPATTPVPTMTLTGHKLWDDEENIHNLRPQSITLELLADGAPVDATPVWADTDTDDWTYTYRNLPTVNSAGATIQYTVREQPVAGYEAEIDGTTITNHLIPQEPKSYVELGGTKTWVDDDNRFGLRTNFVTVRLLRDGEEIASRTVTAADDWKYSFGRLPADDGYGKVYRYSLREDGVKGYFARIKGMDVTNALLTKDDLPPTPEDGIPSRHTATPRPRFDRMKEIDFESLLMLLGYDTPLFGMLGTGDETPAWPYVFGGLGILAVAAWLALERKKRRAAR